ncbi:MAG: hypothetical protein O3B01_17180 [Planctomycetota bacterium]|nr:hypothetical protein [Planctomycetota bacterium]
MKPATDAGKPIHVMVNIPRLTSWSWPAACASTSIPETKMLVAVPSSVHAPPMMAA